MRVQQIELQRIRIDGGTQQRVQLDGDAVREYADAMKAGAEFPVVVLFFDGTDYWLADGFHRFHATRLAERDSVKADVRTGTQREAVLYAACANRDHGVKRTNADKRKAVLTLVADGEWGKWTDSEIGRRCGVSHTFVGDVRRGVRNRNRDRRSSHVQCTSERTYTTKHGTEAQMNVSKIGKSEAPKFKSRQAVEERMERAKAMAADGHTSQQIAAALGVGENKLRVRMREQGVDVPADRVVGKVVRHDSNRILEHIVMDAENLTADAKLIDFKKIDHERLGAWIDSLNSSASNLKTFIRQLVKEHQKHVEAA